MRIGPYEVLGELGRGGFGVVYAARSDEGREVALKLLAIRDPEKLARFERERRLQTSLGEVEGFVPLLDAGLSGAGAWIVMPLLRGGTLRDRLRRGPLGLEETVKLAKALARSLARAHGLGIVHRDLKPENVLFASADGPPLIADLGLSKHTDASSAHSAALSRTGEFRGTPGYCAPEQLLDAKSVDASADVFALGAIVFECLAGSPPFVGESVLELVRKVLDGEREPSSLLRAPSWLVRVTERALATDPALRYADGAAFALALEERSAPRRWPVLALLVVVGAAGLGLALATRQPPALPPASVPRERAPVAPVASKKSDDDPVALSERAAAAVKAGDRKTAQELWTKAFELDPTSIRALIARGSSKRKQGDLKGAFEDFSRAVEIDPNDGNAWARLAGVEGEMGQADSMRRHMMKALEVDPGEPGALQFRASQRANEGDLEGAIADYEYLIKVAPKDGRVPDAKKQIASLKARLAR